LVGTASPGAARSFCRASVEVGVGSSGAVGVAVAPGAGTFCSTGSRATCAMTGRGRAMTAIIAKVEIRIGDLLS